MRRIIIAVLLMETSCAPLGYRDVTGRDRGSDTFIVVSARCQTFARSADADDSEGPPSVSDARLSPLRQRAYDACMRTNGWAPG